MYNVTTEYLSAVRALSRTDRLTGILELKNGTSIELKNNRIYERTLELVHDVISGEEIEFGSALLKQLSFSLRTHQDRYVFYDAKVTPYYGVMLADGTWFDVPLGVFHVAEAERLGQYIQLVAYDDLLKFDKDYDGTPITGTCFEVLVELCEICGLSFGLTEEELAAFPNGDSSIYIDEKSGCSNYRDCLKVIGQKLAAFCTTDRQGKLILKRYSSEVSATLTKSNRFSTKLADYICQYAGITVKAEEKSWSAYNENLSSGLELIIQDAPAWDYGTDETLQAQTEALLAELAGIPYTPSKLTISNDPAIDCGDMLALETDSGTVNTLVTGLTWRFRARMEIESTGQNPYLKAIKPHKTKIIRELEKQTTENKLIFYSFTNQNAVSVSDGEEEELVAQVTFATTKPTSAMFIAQLPVLVECEDTVTSETTTNETEETCTVEAKDSTGASTTVTDAEGNPITLSVVVKHTDTDTVKTVSHGYVDLQVEYYIDGTLVDYELIHRCGAGSHILGLFYTFDSLDGNTNFQWQVKIRVAGGSGTVTVPKRAFRATITGQGMAGTDVWDGTLSFDESVPAIGILSTMTLAKAVEEVTTQTQIPVPAGIEEVVPAFSLRSGMTLVGVTERFSTTEIREKKTIDAAEWVYTDRYVAVEAGSLMARTKWQYESAETEIDSGRMTAVKAVTDGLKDVEVILKWSI